MTSTTKVRWWEAAVEEMSSMASRMRWRAESVPIVMSAPTRSLSIEPTIPVTMSAGWAAPTSGLTRPLATSSSTRPGQLWRNSLVPVSEPSPPMTTSRSMPCSSRWAAASSWPERSRNSAERAVPMIVPPLWRIEPTESHSRGRMPSPPATAPAQPSMTA